MIFCLFICNLLKLECTQSTESHDYFTAEYFDTLSFVIVSIFRTNSIHEFLMIRIECILYDTRCIIIATNNWRHINFVCKCSIMRVIEQCEKFCEKYIKRKNETQFYHFMYYVLNSSWMGLFSFFSVCISTRNLQLSFNRWNWFRYVPNSDT